jgi:hypothetical protein
MIAVDDLLCEPCLLAIRLYLLYLERHPEAGDDGVRTGDAIISLAGMSTRDYGLAAQVARDYYNAGRVNGA